MKILTPPRLCLLLLLLVLMLAGSSCVTVGEENPESVLPSTRPGSWDGKTLAVPL